jgi:hypothetical protein
VSAVERVARGAALLDEQESGWAEQIDLSRLDMGDGCRCVLGQLWGGEPDAAGWEPYNVAVDELKIDGWRLGFSVLTVDQPPALITAEFAELDELWITEICDRQQPAGPAVCVRCCNEITGTVEHTETGPVCADGCTT